MKGKTLLCSMLFILITAPSTLAQRQKIEVHRLNCEGVFMNAPARVTGIRRYTKKVYSYVDFQGQLQSSQGTFGLIYEIGANADGLLLTKSQRIPVSVLDNTGGKMKIYGPAGGGPPPLWGEFVCRWTRLQ